MLRTLLLTTVALTVSMPLSSQPKAQLERLRGKSILLFTPHPDDDTFCCAGTLALLAKGGNRIRIVIYTNDDKGSYDPDMTSERLARIRMHEEEEACRILGIPKESIQWLEYHDGMLEYANTRDLVEEVTGIIRKVRSDVVLSIDPGTEYVRWHKTDHRMAANNTLDAIRAAEWHLYFPNQLLHEGLRPWLVPQEFYYYVTEKDATADYPDPLDIGFAPEEEGRLLVLFPGLHAYLEHTLQYTSASGKLFPRSRDESR
jgi:LmbE family N-acetylglucosaminyl deacetylase